MRDPLLSKLAEAYIQMEKDEKDLDKYWTGLDVESGEIEDYRETGSDGEHEEKPSIDSPGQEGWYEKYYDVFITLIHSVDDQEEFQKSMAMGPDMFKKILWSDEVIQAGGDYFDTLLSRDVAFQGYMKENKLRYDKDGVEILSVENENGKIISKWKIEVVVDADPDDDVDWEAEYDRKYNNFWEEKKPSNGNNRGSLNEGWNYFGL